jgi:hypothetical protein
VRPPNELSYKRPQPRASGLRPVRPVGPTRSSRARAHRPPVCPVIQIKTILTRYHAIHRHTRLQPVGERRRQAGSGQRTHDTTHVPRYPQSTVTLLRMRQVVDTTSLRPGPPAPPQCREWRRSLVSLPHEPPTSDLHASLAATHTHAQQPHHSHTPLTWFGAMSANAPATRPARRDQLTLAPPHIRRAQTDMVRSRARLEPQGLQRRSPRRRGSHAAADAVARRDTPLREVPTAPGRGVGGPS